MKLVWLNGTFGVGKSTTAELIVQLDLRWRAFDPEWVGFLMRASGTWPQTRSGLGPSLGLP